MSGKHRQSFVCLRRQCKTNQNDENEDDDYEYFIIGVMGLIKSSINDVRSSQKSIQNSTSATRSNKRRGQQPLAWQMICCYT
jgi:hypothetical protein